MLQDQVVQYGNSGGYDTRTVGGQFKAPVSTSGTRFETVDKQIGELQQAIQELTVRIRGAADRLFGAIPESSDSRASSVCGGGVMDEWSQRLTLIAEAVREAHSQMSRITGEL